MIPKKLEQLECFIKIKTDSIHDVKPFHIYVSSSHQRFFNHIPTSIKIWRCTVFISFKFAQTKWHTWGQSRLKILRLIFL